MTKSSELNKSQVDRLGDRLRKGDMSEADLEMLNTYRNSFTESYLIVVGRIQKELKLEPTGRFPKSTTSIMDKLSREHVRLSQMQDIAGCRLIVQDLASQDEVVVRLAGLFENSTIDDRRKHPSHGYRAVHVILDCGGKRVEVQVRTQMQQLWAEFSERLSDTVDRGLKYGSGNQELVSHLALASDAILELEMAIQSKDPYRLLLAGDLRLESFTRLIEVVRRVTKGEK